jgi:hypothetical protein
MALCGSSPHGEEDHMSDVEGPQRRGRRPGGDTPEGRQRRPPDRGRGDEEITRRDNGDDECDCCTKIVITLERFKVVKKTRAEFLFLSTSATDDNVVVTAASDGRMVMQPAQTSWPAADPDGEIEPRDFGEGDEERPGVVLATIEPDRNCRFDFTTAVGFWEVDLGTNLAKAIQRTAEEVAHMGAMMAPIRPMSSEGLIDALVRKILRALGIKDTLMQVVLIKASGSLCDDDDFDETLSWVPPLTSFDQVDDNTLRLKRTMKHKGGEWEADILVQKICD